MRFKNSLAAAVAAAVSAVVFSAAFQPAEASTITIDSFTQAQVATGSGGPAVPIVSTSVDEPGSFGGFDTRLIEGQYAQNVTRGTRTVVATSNGSGTGTLQLTNNGSGNGATVAEDAVSVFSYTTGGAVDLTGQQYPGFWIETAATSSTPSDAFKGFIQVSTSGGQSVTYDLPGMWAPNTGTGILFSTLTAINPSLNFTQVEQVTVGIKNTATLPGSTPYNATAQFTLIAVPEPTQMVFVAGVGAALGAWRLRKLRRSREAAGDAIAG
jgi:hypothetical protein